MFGCAAATGSCGARTELTEATAAAPGLSAAQVDAAADGCPAAPCASSPPVPDAAMEACSVAPLCGDDTRGTWRLEAADHQVAGYLFMFDGRETCNSSATAFLLDLARPSGQCSRDGDAMIEERTPTSLLFSDSGLGGSVDADCGDPTPETIHVELRRRACSPASYELVVHDSAANSLFEFTAHATRCRCDIGWDPCARPSPDDPCAP